ncbi:MAG TPA: ABC transporter permease subunit [Candidatus Acidoferrum sp.]|nr:ABC transporter permease subunit [Candidatus Acidoferrum sp.]
MMLLRIALRMQRTGFVATTAFSVFLGLLQAIGFATIVPSNPAERAAFGQQMELLGQQVSYLIPPPIHPETMGGYVQWRVFGSLSLAFAFWAMMSATGAVRGEEQRGLLEQWLTAGVSRGRWMATRVAGFALAAIVAIALTDLACWAGAVVSNWSLDITGLVQNGVALLGLSLSCYALALLLAQLFVERREAAGVTGAVLLALFLINSLGRTETFLQPYRLISPFYYYDQTKAIAPGGSFDVPGTIALFVAAALLAPLATLAFVRRDLGASLIRRSSRDTAVVTTPDPNPLLRVPLLESLYEQRIGLAFWVLGIALIGIFFVSLAKPLVDVLKTVPALRLYLALFGSAIYPALIGAFWYGTLLLLLAFYAITQVARWSSEDGEGRLEMVLSQTVPRWRVVVDRALALLVGGGVIALGASLVTALTTSAQGIALDTGGELRAGLLLVLFTLSFGAVGAVLAGSVPRAAVVILSTLAVASYFLQQLGLLFKWPDIVIKLSVFQLYGNPLVSVYWPGVWALLAITLVGFALAIVMLQRRDVGA